MNTGNVYTTGKSFRAKAERYARLYRVYRLHCSTYDKYGHCLSDADAESGLNFLEPYRELIHNAVMSRSRAGKGVCMERTTKNLLSSQAMCFNLFVPINQNAEYQGVILRSLLQGNFQSLIGKIHIEYTPPKDIFYDQTGRGGVDSDAMFIYNNASGERSIVTIETKYVETNFSQCGFTKSGQKDKCPPSQIVDTATFSNCRYTYKKDYRYWKTAATNNVFSLNKIKLCPFRDGFWQLFTNITLASELKKRFNCRNYAFVVLLRRENTALMKTDFSSFKAFLNDPCTFDVCCLEDLSSSILTCGDWGKAFYERYIDPNPDYVECV